jgi:hypothetical protein
VEGDVELAIAAAAQAMADDVALTTEILTAAVHPRIDLLRSFTDTTVRGPAVLERSLIALTVAVLAGTLLGRTLPALLTAIIATAALLLCLQVGQDAWLRAEAVRMPTADVPAEVSGDKITDVRFQTPSGDFLSYADAAARLAGTGQLPEDAYTPVAFGVPASRYADVTLREGVLTAVVVGLLLVVSAAALERRRPY